MQKHIKNLINILAVSSVLILGASTAFASISTSVSSPQSPGTPVVFTSTVGSVCMVYDTAHGNVAVSHSCLSGASFPYITLSSTPDTYTIVECNPSLDIYCDSRYTLSSAETGPGFISENVFTFSSTPPPPPAVSGLTFFGGTSSGTGGSALTGSVFTSQVANALSATGLGVYPIVALVAGLILALIIATKVIGLFKQTGSSGTGKTGKNYTGTLKRKSQGLWIRE
jgi:hypothetical protein